MEGTLGIGRKLGNPFLLLPHKPTEKALTVLWLALQYRKYFSPSLYMVSQGTLKNVILGLPEVVNELIKALYLAENIS